MITIKVLKITEIIHLLFMWFLGLFSHKAVIYVHMCICVYVYMSAKCFDEIYAVIKYFLGFEFTDNKIYELSEGQGSRLVHI